MGITSGFSGFVSAAALGKLAVYFFMFLLVGAAITAFIIFVLVKKKSTKIVELNMVNKRVRTFTGRFKKPKGGVEKMWVSKLKRYLPKVQQKSVFIKGRQDCVVLLKDNNGLHHTARIPTWMQLKKWYKVVHGIDLEKDEKWKKVGTELKDVYLLPSPHEDLDWLAGQCVEAEKEFIAGHWWQSPTVAIIGTAFICFMMVTVTLIFRNKI